MSVSPELRALLDNSLRQSTHPGAEQHLETAILSSPMLSQLLADAASRTGPSGKPLLEAIEFSAEGSNSAGHFNASIRTLFISREPFAALQTKRSGEEAAFDQVVSTLGHEAAHAFGAEGHQRATNKLDYDIANSVRAAGPDGQVDLTAQVRDYLTAARAEEASAERIGLAVLADRIKHTNGGTLDTTALLERASRTTQCVAPRGLGHALAPGLSLNERGHIPSEQREAVAQCHFDTSQHGLGQPGSANYRNYYATLAIERIEAATRDWANPPTVVLRMDELGLDREQIQGAGLNFERAGRTTTILDPATGVLTFHHNKDDAGRALPSPGLDIVTAEPPPDIGAPAHAPAHQEAALQR